MSTTLIWLLCGTACSLSIQPILKWIVLPILIRNKHLPSLKHNYEITSVEHLTGEQRDLIEEYVPKFAMQGFEVAANVLLHQGVGKVNAVIILFVNRTTGDVARMILTSISLRRSFSLIIRSHFANGYDVATASSSDAGFMPKRPNVNSIRLSWTRDVAALTELHRRRIVHLNLSAQPRIAPASGEEMNYLEQQHRIEINRFIEVGYFYRDDPSGVLRKTLKGTFFTAWKLQQPIKRLRLSLHNRKARRVWNDLAMDQWVTEPELSAVPMTPDVVPGASPTKSGVAISYQSILAPGELSIAVIDDTTVVRLGKPSVKSYLVMRWFSLVWIAVIGFVIIVDAPVLFFLYAFHNNFNAPHFTRFYSIVISMAVLLFLLGAAIISLHRGLQKTGGTSVVSASLLGLHFENAPSQQPRRGTIARNELQNLAIVRVEVRLIRSLYQLEAVMLGSETRQPLLVAANKSTLNEARQSLATALAIKNEEHLLRS